MWGPLPETDGANDLLACRSPAFLFCQARKLYAIQRIEYIGMYYTMFCHGIKQTVIQQGGIQPGGLNFDAKVRRESSDIADLFIAHIGNIDLKCFTCQLSP